MSRARKALAGILCVCFILASVFSIVIVARHAEHKCTGERCEICLMVSHLKDTLKQLVGVAVALVFALAAACLAVLSVRARIFSRPQTLISLKIQLNN